MPEWGYNNFTDAFSDLEDFWESANGWKHWVPIYISNANSEASGEAWEWAIRYTTTAIYWLSSIVFAGFDMYASQNNVSHFLASIWFAGAAAEPTEITMDAILSAMITADISQIEYFVGFVDAYRMALWNEPFNAEFYAGLARGFMP